MILPWQTHLWENMMQTLAANRLPHALLCVGMKGIGKSVFVEALTQALVCQHRAKLGRACSEPDTSCHACHLLMAKTHPDVLWVVPQETSSIIKIDQIREIANFVGQTAFQSEYRVVIINPAHVMNNQAANALLKTLEEPATGAIIILISDQSGQLPATLRSRCQRINFVKPDNKLALSWLETQLTKSKTRGAADFTADVLLRVAQGAPLSARLLQEGDELKLRAQLFESLWQISCQQTDPLKAAQSLYNTAPATLCHLMLSWLIDLLRIQLQADQTMLVNCDYQQQINQLAKTTRLQKNVQLMTEIKAYQQAVASSINLNKQLMLESLFIRWSDCLT
ncbi:MAG: DNA polymerase III subunit delta' [Gammaproteobacteria bacterium]|nr:DNA polymerase III subunit delta' [Gammaproteobacteria bacterium]